MPDSRDQLDRLLDSALATYADPGPDSGLEQRILNRIAAEMYPARRRRWIAWAIALPAVAGLLIFAVLAGRGHDRAPSSVSTQAHNLQKQSAPDWGGVGENRAMRSEGSGTHTSGPKGHIPVSQFAARLKSCPDTKPCSRRTVLVTSSAPLPKLDVFPTPQPPTSQERAFALYVARTPLPERQALAVAGQEPIPITIAEINSMSIAPRPAGAN